MAGMSIRPFRDIERRKSRQIMIGSVPVGGDAPISVQTMTNTPTEDANATIHQIRRCEEAGADIIRVSCPTVEATTALKEIVRAAHVPIVADIHFHYKRALEAADAGAACLRINPGNIGSEERVQEVITAAKANGCAIGIGKLLWAGIGDTIRVSLSAEPEEEVRVGYEILKALGIRSRGVRVVSCPSCARQGFDVIRTVEALEARLQHIKTPMSLSVLGCVVNGPGEARETDIGITGGGNGTHMVYLSGVTDHHVKDGDMIDHIVRLVEAKAAELEAEADGAAILHAAE